MKTARNIALWFCVAALAALLAWPAALTGYDLEQNADLATANWLPVTDQPVVVGDEK